MGAARRVETRAGVAHPLDLWQNKGGEEMTLSAPIWIVALALAACAPWCVRAISDGLEARVRRRTEALVARALAASGLSPTPGAPSPRVASPGEEDFEHEG